MMNETVLRRESNSFIKRGFFPVAGSKPAMSRTETAEAVQEKISDMGDAPYATF